MSKRTIENCSVIKRGLALGIGKPYVESNGKCVGYSHSDDDDEPHDLCKNCRLNSSYESD